MTTILITGFGRFPGAPYNPSGPLARAVARRRRPAFADVQRIVHIFETSYAAVDRDLPKLLARHKPDIVLMFGLAGRTPQVRIETRARNAKSILFPDVTGYRPDDRAIVAGAPPAARPRPVRPPARRRAVEPRAARGCRAMPGVTCATTSTGARSRASRSGSRSRSSSTFRRSRAVHGDRDGSDVSRTPRSRAPARPFCSRFWRHIGV